MAVVESLNETPTFSDVFQGLYEYLHQALAGNLPPNKLDSWNFSTYDFTCVLVMTVLLSALRFFLTKRVFMPIAAHYGIPVESRKKIPESAWGFTFQICSCSYTWYVLVLSGKYHFFQNPETLWHGWSLEAFPPGDIYFIYVIYSAYYFHFTYAALFLDARRKDFFAMVFHHVMTLCLMFMSHATRCHTIGILTLFLQHVSLVFYEFCKLCLCLQIPSLKVQVWIGVIRNIGFACFAVTWFTSRLYWYPLKVLYPSVQPHIFKLKVPYYLSMQLQLWGYLVLNIYWSVFILKTVYNMATGQKLKDLREAVDAEKCSEALPFEDKCSNSFLKVKHYEFSSRRKRQ